MKTSNVYQKHLDLSKRIKIEKGIEENKNFTQIADDISKSYKTVSNEIKRNRNIEHCTSWYGKEKVCEKTLKPPYVCNACPSRRGCRKTRYYYYAKDAQAEYERKLSESRKGIDMTSTEFKYLNDIVSNEIKNGHSLQGFSVECMINLQKKKLTPVTKQSTPSNENSFEATLEDPCDTLMNEILN